MYCIHLSFIFISWLVGWLMYLLGECCASCSSMIHEPPSIYLLSFFPWSFLNHSLKTGGPLMSTWFFSNMIYPQISPSFLFFLLLVLSAYWICLFSYLSLLFLSHLDLSPTWFLSFFIFVVSLFCFTWICHLLFMRSCAAIFLSARVFSILLMRPCAAIFLSVFVSDDCWLQIDCWWPDCMTRWWRWLTGPCDWFDILAD